MKHFSLFILFAIVLSSCAPAVPTQPTLVSTQTAILSTDIPLPPTATLTPAPENLADAKDLSIWIENYVDTYGSKVSVNGVDMDASQFLNKIKENPDSFTQVKQVNGIEFSFLVLNDTPLAIRDETGNWQEATIKKIAQIANVHVNITGIYDEKNLMKKEFTSFSSGWAFIWTVFKPDSPDQYKFDITDNDIKFAQEIGADNIQVFHLVWGWQKALPDWLTAGNFTNDELQKIMEQHIQKTVSRYKGRVAAWSVVNEPFGSSNSPGNSSFWGNKLGNDPEKGISWIGTAFQIAHAADPNAKLFLNDTGIEFGVQKNDTIFGQKSDTIFNLAKALREQGYPIDGIGFQMHLFGQELLSPGQRELKMQQLANQIQRYQNIGLEIRITELDVNMTGIPGTEQERRNMQSEIYKSVFDTALKEGVKEFTIFGVRDEESWLISTYGYTDAEPSLFDKQGIKPSYYAVVQSLYEYIP